MPDESVLESHSIVIPEGRFAAPSREPILSQLDLTQRFITEKEIHDPDFEASSSQIIPINSTNERPLAIQAINIRPTSEDTNEITTVFMYDTSNSELPSLVGYSTYNLDRSNNSATIDINSAKSRRYSKAIDSLPPHIRSALDNSNLMEAFEITDNELRNEGGHGKNLWLLSAAILELQGIQEITIHGDITIGTVEAETSFYGKMGATPNGDGTQRYQVSENLDRNRATILNLLAQ